MSERTYGRKIVRGQKEEVLKRIYTSWIISAVVGFALGALITWGITSLFNDSVEPVEQVQFEEPAPLEPVYIDDPSYGTIDGKVFENEIPMQFGSAAELGFTPLDVPMEEDMQEFIYHLCHGYNIEFPFVMALIEHESSFQSDVVSATDDYGLMQINWINHGWLNEKLGVTDLLNPYENVRSGVFILRKLFESYEDPALVLMAYNMGEGGASNLWSNGVYETDYSRSIMEQAVTYENEILEKENK